MSLLEFLHRRGIQLALMVNGLLSLGVTYASIVYFNSTPQPAPQAQVGSVAINLKMLGGQFGCEDMKSAGMLRGLDNRKCDFQAQRKSLHLHLKDFSDHELMATLYLYRPHQVLWLHFFSNDIPVGRQRLDRSLLALRSQYPGRGDAIRLISSPEDRQQLYRDW